ncbi:MAG: hypothetical protein J1F36_04910 [Clostridiales bacterium]|nr:hypothetical protein [Clostridiales bacterium]
MSKFIKSKTATLFMVIMLMITIGALMFTVSGCTSNGNNNGSGDTTGTPGNLNCTSFKHNYQRDAELSKDATCSAAGVEVYKCTNCGDVYTVAIPQIGHTWTETEVDASCTTQGYILHECSVCHTSYQSDFSAPSHTFEFSKKIDPTCTTAGYTLEICKDCGTVREIEPIKASGHSYDYNGYKFRKEPTCVEFGFERYECDNCGDVYIVTLKDLGHNLNYTTNLAATCEGEGRVDAVCTRDGCGYELHETTAALGHAINYGTYSRSKEYAACRVLAHASCIRCGKTDDYWHLNDATYAFTDAKDAEDSVIRVEAFYDKYPELAMAPHKFDLMVVKRTLPGFGPMVPGGDAYYNVESSACEGNVRIAYICSVCKPDDYIGSVAKALKCVEKPDSEVTYANGIGHTWEAEGADYKFVTATEDQAVAATCTTDGFNAGAHLCARCRKVDTNKEHYTEGEYPIVAALGHTWTRTENTTDEDKWDYTIVKATCTTAGSAHYECKDCQTVDTDKTVATIPATGHAWDEDAIVCKAKPELTDANGKYYDACANGCGLKKPVEDHDLYVRVRVDAETWEREDKWYDDGTSRFDIDCSRQIYCDACEEIFSKGLHWRSIEEYLKATPGVSTREELEAVKPGVVANCQHGDYCPACYIPATADSEGYHYEINDKTLPHNWVDDTDANSEPTCTEPGYKGTKCSMCGTLGEDSEEIPATGHKWGEEKEVLGTCQEEGYFEKECTVCHTKETRTNGKKADHNLQQGPWVTWPTCTEDGEAVVYCVNDGCDYGDRRTIEGSKLNKDGKWHMGVELVCGEHCSTCVPATHMHDEQLVTVNLVPFYGTYESLWLDDEDDIVINENGITWGSREIVLIGEAFANPFGGLISLDLDEALNMLVVRADETVYTFNLSITFEGTFLLVNEALDSWGYSNAFMPVEDENPDGPSDELTLADFAGTYKRYGNDTETLVVTATTITWAGKEMTIVSSKWEHYTDPETGSYSQLVVTLELDGVNYRMLFAEWGEDELRASLYNEDVLDRWGDPEYVAMFQLKK